MACAYDGTGESCIANVNAAERRAASFCIGAMRVLSLVLLVIPPLVLLILGLVALWRCNPEDVAAVLRALFGRQ